MSERLRGLVREIPDFPRPGILFRDITPLLADRAALAEAVEALAAPAAELKPEFVLAAEARGFVLSAALALRLDAGLLLARKPGRLPAGTLSAAYALEYGEDRLELHEDCLPRAARVLIHDDLLATGGTACALSGLVSQAAGELVGACFLIELQGLQGRARLAPMPVQAVMSFQ